MSISIPLSQGEALWFDPMPVAGRAAAPASSTAHEMEPSQLHRLLFWLAVSTQGDG